MIIPTSLRRPTLNQTLGNSRATKRTHKGRSNPLMRAGFPRTKEPRQPGASTLWLDTLTISQEILSTDSRSKEQSSADRRSDAAATAATATRTAATSTADVRIMIIPAALAGLDDAQTLQNDRDC